MKDNQDISRPTLIIGVGGLGKHVVTHVKYMLENRFLTVPEEVGIFALDTAKHIDVRKPSIMTVKDWDKEEFMLDYESSSKEFAHFGAKWGFPVTEIADPKKASHPYISKWLKDDDARKYKNLPDEDLSAKEGVGRMRQASRACLFIRLGENDFVEKLRSVIHKVARYGKPDEPMRVFIVGSIAGGTGCGALWDIATLIHHFVKDGNYEAPQILGAIVLPKGFEGLRGKDIVEEQYMEMQANCFAAYRELERLMHTGSSESPFIVEYSDIVKEVVIDNRLFSFIYFLDGVPISYLSRDTEEKKAGSAFLQYNEGIVPAIADFIGLHLFGYTDDYPGIATSMSSRFNEAQVYPRDGRVYSSFGIHRYIFDAQGIINTFAPELGQRIANRFIVYKKSDDEQTRPSSQNLENRVLEFLGNTDNLPLNRTTNELLQRPYDIPVSETHFLSKLKPAGVKNVQIRPIDLSKMRVSTIGKARASKELISETESHYWAHMGSIKDILGERDNQGSVYAVMNYYHKHNCQLFQEVLAKFVESSADGVKNQASLLYTSELLNLLEENYDIVYAQLNNIAEKIEKQKNDITKKVDYAKTILERSKSGRDQKKYLTLKQDQAKIERLYILVSYMVLTIEDFKKLVSLLTNDVNSYIQAMSDLNKHMAAMSANMQHVREDHIDSYKVHNYITRPWDRWEKRLFELIYGAEASGKLETALIAPLNIIKMDDLVNQFRWRVVTDEDNQGKIAFRGYMSEEYIPIEATQREIDQWNFQFVRRMVQMGFLNQITDKINIFDILAWQMLSGIEDTTVIEKKSKEQSQSLFDALKTASSAMIQYDKTSQERSSDYDITTSGADIRQKILAPWKNSEPGNLISKALQELAGDFGENYSNSNHEILAYSTLHFIRMDALSSLTNTENTYLNSIKRDNHRPVHIFLAERNSTDYERYKEQRNYPGIKRTTFCPQVVALLEYEDDLKVFTSAYLLDKMKKEEKNEKTIYQIDVAFGTKIYPIELPFNLLKAAEKYCLPNGADPSLKEAFKKQLDKDWEDIRNSIKETSKKDNSKINTLLNNYTQIAEDLRIEGTNSKNAAEGDLQILLSLIIDQKVESLKVYI